MTQNQEFTTYQTLKLTALIGLGWATFLYVNALNIENRKTYSKTNPRLRPQNTWSFLFPSQKLHAL